MKLISISLSHWKEKYNTYPKKLSNITKNRPLRQEWLTDTWNKAYKYSINKKGDSFQLISAGIDRVFNTKDDIIIMD